MSSRTHIAEKTLRDLQKRRSTPACYPCFRRKVKCRGGRPCEACTERNHPEICHVEEMSKGSRRHPKGKIRHSAATYDEPAHSAGSGSITGDLQTAKSTYNRVVAPERKNGTPDATSISSPGFPISLTTLSGDMLTEKESPPLRAEILQYYAPFRDLVMPMYPIVPDPLSFEVLMEDLLSGTCTDAKPERLAVVLSSLALGAQFTEAQVDGRWDVSQHFIARANVYLQRANSIFEPSAEVVQALLMIGICLQNLGLSNGAWNLLGLTYRCAQSLGFHTCTDEGEAGHVGAVLWTAIIWQDCLMSLRYDRTPLTQIEPGKDTAYLPPAMSSYHQTISKLCRVSINMLQQSTTWRRDPQNVSSKVSYLEDVVATAPDHLSPLCTTRTLQQKFQYYAVRLHSSLLIVEFSRPIFNIHDAEIDNAHRAIRRKGCHYLFLVVESFLELCTFSNIPFRLWSILQAAVSCALVLALIDSKHPLPRTQELLRRLIDTFRTNDVPGVPLLISSLEQPEIYGKHEKAVNLLESILNRTNKISVAEGQASIAPTTMQDAFPKVMGENAFDLMADDFLSWPTELSLYDSTFPDAILEGNMENVYIT